MTLGVTKKTDSYGGVSFTLLAHSGGNVIIASYRGVAKYLSPAIGLTQVATPEGKRVKTWLDCITDVEEYQKYLGSIEWLTEDEKKGIVNFLEEEFLYETKA